MDTKYKDIIDDLRNNNNTKAAILIENLLFKVDILAKEIEDACSEIDSLEDEIDCMNEDAAGASI